MSEKNLLVKKEFDPFQAMDALDDKAIIAEMEGRVVENWVYHFKQDSKEVWGLSKVGIDAACREMAKQGEAIREEDVTYAPDPTAKGYVLFKASASRVVVSKDGKEVVLDRAFGTKRQALYHFGGSYNNFWFEHGTIKALRNARNRLLSEEIRNKIMVMAKEKGKVEKVNGSVQEKADTGEKGDWDDEHFYETMKTLIPVVGKEKFTEVLKNYKINLAKMGDIKKIDVSLRDAIIAELKETAGVKA